MQFLLTYCAVCWLLGVGAGSITTGYLKDEGLDWAPAAGFGLLVLLFAPVVFPAAAGWCMYRATVEVRRQFE